MDVIVGIAVRGVHPTCGRVGERTGVDRGGCPVCVGLGGQRGGTSAAVLRWDTALQHLQEGLCQRCFHSLQHRNISH